MLNDKQNIPGRSGFCCIKTGSPALKIGWPSEPKTSNGRALTIDLSINATFMLKFWGYVSSYSACYPKCFKACAVVLGI